VLLEHHDDSAAVGGANVAAALMVEEVVDEDARVAARGDAVGRGGALGDLGELQLVLAGARELVLEVEQLEALVLRGDLGTHLRAARPRPEIEMIIIDAISQPKRVGTRLQSLDALSDEGAKAGAGRARCRRSSSPHCRRREQQ
jgi:hypothetical protein